VVSVCFVQFVRSVAPSTSYALAFAYFGQAYKWKFYLVAHLTTMAVTATGIERAIENVVVGSVCKAIPLKRDDGAAKNLQKLVDSKLRVVILIMPAPEMREIAVEWKQRSYKDRWVWMTDNKILQIDFDSDTSKVRPTSAFRSFSGATVA
jgi:hypothetical protein